MAYNPPAILPENAEIFEIWNIINGSIKIVDNVPIIDLRYLMPVLIYWKYPKNKVSELIEDLNFLARRIYGGRFRTKKGNMKKR
jgi:hypothetical protein